MHIMTDTRLVVDNEYTGCIIGERDIFYRNVSFMGYQINTLEYQ